MLTLTKNLRGYSAKQRNLAYAIRQNIMEQFPWGLDSNQASRLFDRLLIITSPMFWIKYQTLLTSGKIAQAISEYDDANYYRRASFVTKH